MKTTEEKLAKIFAARRKKLGLSYKQVEDLGKKFGAKFNYQTVFRLEKGRLRLKPSVLKEIARALSFKVPKALIPEMKPVRFSKEVKGDLGAVISSKRMKMEMTQVEFARLLGVCPVVVSGLERGVYKASSRTLAKISNALEAL